MLKKLIEFETGLEEFKKLIPNIRGINSQELVLIASHILMRGKFIPYYDFEVKVNKSNKWLITFNSWEWEYTISSNALQVFWKLEFIQSIYHPEDRWVNKRLSTFAISEENFERIIWKSWRTAYSWVYGDSENALPKI